VIPASHDLHSALKDLVFTININMANQMQCFNIGSQSEAWEFEAGVPRQTSIKWAQQVNSNSLNAK